VVPERTVVPPGESVFPSRIIPEPVDCVDIETGNEEGLRSTKGIVPPVGRRSVVSEATRVPPVGRRSVVFEATRVPPDSRVLPSMMIPEDRSVCVAGTVLPIGRECVVSETTRAPPDGRVLPLMIMFEGGTGFVVGVAVTAVGTG